MRSTSGLKLKANPQSHSAPTAGAGHPSAGLLCGHVLGVGSGNQRQSRSLDSGAHVPRHVQCVVRCTDIIAGQQRVGGDGHPSGRSVAVILLERNHLADRVVSAFAADADTVIPADTTSRSVSFHSAQGMDTIPLPGVDRHCLQLYSFNSLSDYRCLRLQS